MHPELLSALATEHRRDLTAGAARQPRRTRARHAVLPHYKLTWTRTKLAAATAGRRGSSLVIVISATRAL